MSVWFGALAIALVSATGLGLFMISVSQTGRTPSRRRLALEVGLMTTGAALGFAAGGHAAFQAVMASNAGAAIDWSALASKAAWPATFALFLALKSRERLAMALSARERR